MKMILCWYYIKLSGILLLITGAAKLISATGSARVLEMRDPILLISFRYVFIIVGCIELIICAFCLLSCRTHLQAQLIAWLAASFVIYRLELIMIDYQGPCHCAGNLTEMIHISANAINYIMTAILTYLLGGSYLIISRHMHTRVKAK
jgi:hypothetical protein